MEVPPDGGQGDVDDGHVEPHDEEAHRADEQDADTPPPAQRIDHGRALLSSFCNHNGYITITIFGPARTEKPHAAAAVWFYDDPYEAVAEIKGHVAFYGDPVTVTAEPTP